MLSAPSWLTSRMAWLAGLLALFGLLRSWRRIVPADDRPEALLPALAVVLVAALVPVSFRGESLGSGAAGVRKAVQFFGAAMTAGVTALLGADAVLAAVAGMAVALVVPLLWPRQAPADDA